MKISNLLSDLNKQYAFDLALDFDNVGLIIGKTDVEITSILVCLDVNLQVIQEAITNNCNTIISHHPFIFHGLKTINNDKYDLYELIFKHGLNIIAMHTNVDVFENSIAMSLIESYFSNYIVIEHEFSSMGVVEFDNAYSKDEFINLLSAKIPHLKYSGSKNQVKRICLANGSGNYSSSFSNSLGCDAFLAGEISHNEFVDYYDKRLTIDIGHEAEIIFVDMLVAYLKLFSYTICKSQVVTIEYKDV